MSIVFDEVVGTVEGPPSGQGAPQPAAAPEPSEREARRRFQSQLAAHQRRLERVRAT
ncbi:MAG: hypothetical protein H6741_02350 [Alphaproteobacteria bacterium]|nr:hypothetical protein [Alphaproteobacteria bacterium]MCB9791545.1 hypothetical protein [Alphaproteobacteria bacterium]